MNYSNWIKSIFEISLSLKNGHIQYRYTSSTDSNLVDTWTWQFRTNYFSTKMVRLVIIATKADSFSGWVARIDAKLFPTSPRTYIVQQIEAVNEHEQWWSLQKQIRCKPRNFSSMLYEIESKQKIHSPPAGNNETTVLVFVHSQMQLI